jgi:osmotically-inducible protein OsmY
VREPLDDATLAHKVESVLFRITRVPKGQISINAESGTVFLRGQLASEELIREIEESVREIPDVAEVVSLLHVPGTEAPHPRAGRRLAGSLP